MSPAEFRAKLIFEDTGGLPFTLYEAFTYYSLVLDRVIQVPKGFVTDLASIPRLLWRILPPIGAYDAAAVIHDFLYRTNGVTRKQADAVFNEAMALHQVSALVRWAMYRGVRLGGWVPWNKYRKAEK